MLSPLPVCLALTLMIIVVNAVLILVMIALRVMERKMEPASHVQILMSIAVNATKINAIHARVGLATLLIL